MSADFEASAVATTATLSGSTTGTTGAPTTWTVALDAAVPIGGGTVSISASGATLSSSTLTFTFGGATSLTFTIDRATDGTTAVSITNSMGLSNAGTPRNYTTEALVPSDFSVRATGAGVVWAHGPDTQDEIDAFLTGGSAGGRSHAGTPTMPYLVADPVVGNCVRFVALGALLTADLPASGGAGPRSMVIDDDTYWPDPAATNPATGVAYGSYYVMTTHTTPDNLNNLWLVTAKSGLTLTVTWQNQSGQPLTSGTQTDWVIGDHVGAQGSYNWGRLFSALDGASNGTGVDDINNAGTTMRSLVDTVSWPRGSVFGYGWYGHADEQAAHTTWRPSDHGSGVDSVLRSNLWDGAEFYVQWRQRMDARFLALNTVAYNSDNRFGRKTWMLQSQMTVPQQITGGYSPGATRFQIPSTDEPVFGINGYSFGGGLAGRTLTNQLDGNGTFQPGSSYAATAIVAAPDLSPSAAWEIPSGEWVTFLLRVKPGHRWQASNPTGTGVRDTEIEMKVARYGESSYTTVFSVTDQAIVYGSSGPIEDVWTSALPGYNCMNFTGYLNMDLGSVPPRGAYAYDVAQVIFSHAPIAPPAVWPFTLPAPGTIGTISTNTLNDTTADSTEQFGLNKVLGDWCSAAVVLTKVAGVVTEIEYVIFGGGHDGTQTNNGVYSWKASTGAFSRRLAPETQTAHAIADATHGEDTTGRPGSQHTYSHVKGLNSDEANGPAYMQLYGAGIEQGAAKSAQGHRFDTSAATWARFGNVGTVPTTDVSAIVKDTLREEFVHFPCDAGTAFYTLDYSVASPTWQTFAQTARTGGWSATTPAVIVHDTVRDLYIGGRHSGSSGTNFRALDATNRTGAWVELTFSGSGPTGVFGQGLMYRPIDDTFLLVDCSTNPPTGVYVLTPPASSPLTNAWTWSRRSFTGTSNFGNRASNSTDSYERFQYVEALDSIIVCPQKDYAMEAWRL